MRTSALFVQKTSDFSKFMVCPHGQFGRGQFFVNLRGRLLWTTRKSYKKLRYEIYVITVAPSGCNTV